MDRESLYVLLSTAILTIIVYLLVFVTMSMAHQAPTGWAYPYSCCHDKDCRQVSDLSVKETPEGYVVASGEVIPYNDKRIKHSPDGYFHWCTVLGKEDSRTICLFVPPRAY